MENIRKLHEARVHEMRITLKTQSQARFYTQNIHNTGLKYHLLSTPILRKKTDERSTKSTVSTGLITTTIYKYIKEDKTWK